MKNYSDTTLDRDRAFDINSINELLTQGKSILKEAIGISRQMESSITAISGVYGGIDGEYRVSALGSDIASLTGKLNKNIYQETINYMNAALMKIMDNIPAHDGSLARGVDGIKEVLDSVKGRISDLKGLLETGDVELNYIEFRSRLEDLKTAGMKPQKT